MPVWLNRIAGLRRSLERKLLAAILLPLLVLCGGLGLWASATAARIYSERFDQVAAGLVETEATHIESFLALRGGVVDGLLANQHFLSFFANQRERLSELGPGWPEVQATFANIDRDPTVTSFLASALTGEYYEAKGRYDDPDYDARTRWWWPEAIAKDRLYVQSPASDAETNKVVVVIKNLVRTGGEVVGVAGVDVDIGAIGERVKAISYNGTGAAMLVDDGGAVVYFSPLDFDRLKAQGERVEVALADLDRLLERSAGFAELGQRMLAGDRGRASVTLEGEPMEVVYAPVDLDHPQVSWSLGLAIPRSEMVGPIRRAALLTFFAVFGVLFLVAVSTTVATRRLVGAPVASLAERFRDVVDGQGDLTQRLEVASEDELGELAQLFNRFVAQIRDNVAAIAELATSLQDAAQELSALSHQMGTAAEGSSRQMATMSSAAHQVSGNVGEVASATTEMEATIREIAARANEAASVVTSAVDITGTTNRRFSELSQSATSIGSILAAIQSIAAQTNLLALNATIEAARAGEAGAGFAVVAGEVKALASQSGGATDEIRDLTEAIQQSTVAAGEAIAEIAAAIQRVEDIQAEIASAMEQQSATTSEISRNVNLAASSSSDIAASLGGITDLVRAAADSGSAAAAASDKLAKISRELTGVVERFRY